MIGAPNQPMEKFVLVDKSAKPPIEIKAAKLTPFLKSNEKVAVAIVMNGWEMWIGNDKEVPTIREDDPSRYPGVLIELRSALDQLKFAESGPPGSLGMVITYGDKPAIRVPMGPLGEITGSKLGTQQDYFGTTGVELVSAIRLAMSELKKVQVSRRVLIVVCDGNDTNNDAAKGQLLDLKKQAAQDHVQTFAIVYKAKLSGEGNVIPVMIPSTQQVTTAQNIATSIANILARMDDRKYLTFNGFNKKTETGLTFDGKAHDLVVKVDKDESEVTSVMLQPWNLAKDDGFPIWAIILLIVPPLLFLIMAVSKIFEKKPVEVPWRPAPIMPMPVEAPKPMGPMKTVMIGQGGDEGGFPDRRLAGAAQRPHAYQTFHAALEHDQDRHRAAVRHRRQRRLHEHRALPDQLLAAGLHADRRWLDQRLATSTIDASSRSTTWSTTTCSRSARRTSSSNRSTEPHRVDWRAHRPHRRLSRARPRSSSSWSRRRATRRRRTEVCGGCRRVMLPVWTTCLFCGWAPVARLEFIMGPLANQALPLTEEVTTIGSVAGNTVVLADPAVSRKHPGFARSTETTSWPTSARRTGSTSTATGCPRRPSSRGTSSASATPRWSSSASKNS